MDEKNPEWGTDKQTTYVTIAMISLGIGESVGVLFNGWVQDKYGIKIAIYANMAQMILAFITIMLYTWVDNFKLWSASMMCFFWGSQDAGINNFAACICAFQFDSAIIPFSLLYAI